MSSLGLASDLCLGRPSDHHPNLLSAAHAHGLHQHLGLVNPSTEAAAAAAANSNHNPNANLIQLETYVRALEHERQKIDGFQRELPICMKLLEEAIESSKMKLASKTVHDDHPTATVPTAAAQQLPGRAIYRHSQINNNTAAAAAESAITNSSLTFSSWPASAAAASNWAPDIQKAQYETCTAQYITQLQQQQQEELSKPAQQLFSSSPELINWTNHQQRVSPRSCSDQQVNINIPDSTMVMSEACNNYNLSSNGSDIQQRNLLMDQLMMSTTAHLGTMSATGQLIAAAAAGHPQQNQQIIINQQQQQQQQHHQPPRKARRCWSPELHQRFLHALHQLGGPHLATPKQIREVMNVEGLTNDEVKSHLQKYRLHTRRPVQQASDSPTQQPHHLVLFGGIWMPSTAAVDQTTSPAAAAAQLAAAAGLHVDPLRGFCHPSTPNARSATEQSSFMHSRPNVVGRGEYLHGQLDCPASMESASEDDVARSDQSTSLNQHDDDTDTQIHLVSKPTRGLF